MKSRTLIVAGLCVLISLSGVAFAQSQAQKSFEKLKSLAGFWTGTYEGGPIYVSIRVTSTGNAIMHEMTGAEKPEEDVNHPSPCFIWKEIGCC
jgi:hypothetical protein